MNHVRRYALAFLLLAVLPAKAPAQEPPPRVIVVALDDQLIQPVTQRYLSRAIQQAAERGAECVIIQLDTPGGLMDSTRPIVRDILTSEVPVIVYIAPSGARARSAGGVMMLGGDPVVVAPGT